LYGAETRALRKLDKKYVGSYEMWCWRMMQKICWTYRVRNEVLQRLIDDDNIVHKINGRNGNWIGHTWRRNCLLRHVTGGKIEG